MSARLFHIFRNTPIGRETLFQSLYFCKKTGATPLVYIPEFQRLVLSFKNDTVEILFDSSYLSSPDTASDHAKKLLGDEGFDPVFLEPTGFSASVLPNMHTDFDYMCCPRSISDLSSKLGLGHIGGKVRQIVRRAKFPVLITNPVYKPWQSLAVFFGGSENAILAFKMGLRISKSSGLPLDVFTQAEGKQRREYEVVLEREGIDEIAKENVRDWLFFESGRFDENLYSLPHDALVVAGAFGHGLVKDAIFGSKIESIQSTVPNNLLIVGPNCRCAHSQERLTVSGRSPIAEI